MNNVILSLLQNVQLLPVESIEQYLLVRCVILSHSSNGNSGQQSVYIMVLLWEGLTSVVSHVYHCEWIMGRANKCLYLFVPSSAGQTTALANRPVACKS